MGKIGRGLSLIIKFLVLIAIVGVGILVYQTCSGSPLLQKIARTLPDKAAAPFEVSTVIKIYEAVQAVSNADGSVTMSGWYDKVGGKWLYHSEKITLLPVLKPKVNKR